MACSVVLLKPNVVNILLFNLYEQKFLLHGPTRIAIDCNGLSLLICEEKWRNYASKPKSAPNSDSFWVRRLFNVCVRVFYAPNEAILLVYIPAKVKMSLRPQVSFVLRISTHITLRESTLGMQNVFMFMHIRFECAFCNVQHRKYMRRNSIPHMNSATPVI